MNSLFNSDKRDEALECLAIGITESAKNCATVIKNINIFCQRPRDFPNPSELINDWTEHLFSNHFHDLVEESASPNKISKEHVEELANAFFNYFASLTPFFYENKTIISPQLIKPIKYKWTADDYKELKIKLLSKWFYNEWDSWDGEKRLKLGYKLELNSQKVVRLIAASSRANSSIWNKQKKIDAIIFPNDLKSLMIKVMPSYKYQYQSDLFLKYTDDFITQLPAAFIKFDDNFYKLGTYLRKYFQWSSNL
ncbi:hypothetical protein V9K67_22020 [Paraflavisolibacter sp. H34]|uniref:hypothetical protein n=1 Tax=Huijunlia imazamoxiresistens TaxID=3127457 RepID=UPI003018110B